MESMSSEAIGDLLPLPLIRSGIVPPAPNRHKSAIDFLPDFGGSAWIAYGAASLLVVSHFPSPRSDPQGLVGPSFRQVIDPEIPPSCSAAAADGVIAVRWCPHRPSDGEIAAAVGDCVFLSNPDSVTAAGSFCWRQTAGLLQSFKVEAVEWTGSGDGLIAAGIDVVLWKRQKTSWEIAWKSKADFPQALVSATWYAEGLVATAANLPVHCIDMSAKHCSLSREDFAHVSVYHNDGNSGVVKIPLYHPQPATMIQWRPSTITRSSQDVLHSWRDVLLTCCSDGTVRLWSEIDCGRSRKYKDIHEHKMAKRSFHVVAIIEINHCMVGMLGKDIFIEWVIELGSVVSKLGDSYRLSSSCSEYDQFNKCEWLISIGPSHTLTFWAIHCLDDVNPLRFPRVTLWKKLNLMDFSSYNLFKSDCTNIKEQPILIKAVALRSQAFGPPVECSFVHLLSDNSVSWSQLYSSTQNGLENRSLRQMSKEKSLSCFAGGVLNQDGHTGSILQFAIHPNCGIELAVSLDSDGFILFWSLPTISNRSLGIQMLDHLAWKLLGKVSLEGFSSGIKYSSVRWAPSVLDENLFLLLGYADGIDCFLIKFSGKGRRILCDKIVSVPFVGHSHGEGPPDQLSAIPLASSCEQSFSSNCFLLFAVWLKKLQASSWRVILHSAEPSRRSCECSSDAGIVAISGKEGSSSYAGKAFYATVILGSSLFPDPQNLDDVISVSLTSPVSIVPSIEQHLSSDGIPSNKYHMATGFSDGTLKLWRMCHAESSNSAQKSLPWELVGMFTAHEGPVSVVSLSSCSGKVATVSLNDRDSTSSLRIWEPISLINRGSFLLEDAVALNHPVIALNWLSIGNGHLLLAICFANELRIYSEKRSDPFLGKSEKSSEMHIWRCIALYQSTPVSLDFSWGPKVTPVLIHKKHFSLISQWLFIPENGSRHEGSGGPIGGIDQNMPFPIFAERNIYDVKKSSKFKENGLDISTLVSKTFQSLSDFDSVMGTRILSMLDVVDKLCEPLAFYHPMALLQHLYSGSWKLAYVVLKHLVRAIKSDEAAATTSESITSGISYCHIPAIDLYRYFKEVDPIELRNSGLQWGQENASRTSSSLFQKHGFQFADDISNTEASENYSSYTPQKFEVMSLIETLEKSPDINGLRNVGITQLLAIIDLLGELSESCYSSVYDSLDKPGRRFWVSVRFQSLCSQRKFGRTDVEELTVNSRLLAWASQSDCHDNLLSSLLSANPSWPEMRNLGMGFWFTNASQLRTRMEKLARSQYLIKKDPKDCALLYLALNRVQVLAGLFKISKDEKDKLLVGFLSRNFQEEKNKAAALKNAYVLMGRHQLELAIAFFLLGGDPSSAVNVCAKNLGDQQLALVICRLIEGHGGKLEHQLISNILLPNAIEQKDYWLASLLEWTLGNFSSSINTLLDYHLDPLIDNPTVSNLCAFLDPEIGQYCATLATKNNMRNSLGYYPALTLSKLATLMSARAFSRCGFPLEALECYSPIFNNEGNDRGSLLDVESHMVFCRILKPISCSASNWVVAGIADALELDVKLNITMQFISKLIRDHPSWPLNHMATSEKLIFHEHHDREDEKQVRECMHMLSIAISTFERKYLLKSVDLISMILAFASNRGLCFHGYRLLHGNSSDGHDTNGSSIESSMLGPTLPRLLLKASQEILCSFSHYVVCCNLTDSILKLLYGKSESYVQCHRRIYCLRSLILSLRAIRPLLKLSGFCEGLNLIISSVLDLLVYCLLFASSWFSRNLGGLTLMTQTILNEHMDHQSSFDLTSSELMKVIRQSSEWMIHDVLVDGIGNSLDANITQELPQKSETSMVTMPDDETWQLVGVCLWAHISGFVNHQLSDFLGKEMIEDGSTIVDLKSELPVLVTKIFVSSTAYISSSLSRQLASFLRQKVSKGLPVALLVWLEESSHHKFSSLHNFSNQRVGPLEFTGKEQRESLFQKLWEISVHPAKICENFVNERILCFQSNSRKFPASWKDVQKGVLSEDENDVSSNIKARCNIGDNTKVNEDRSTFNNRLVTDGLMETRRSSNPQIDDASFHKPVEVLKRSGELLEAICFNSIDEQQVAVASNRKGILFFNWKAEQHFREQAEYLWSESDWPQDGWAGCESSPIPTCVSQGTGLGNKEGTHLGLGVATTGLGSLARPGRDLTGGGAFGIPGYAGIGASGLGWGEQEDFEEFTDPPASVTNISSRALSRHPFRPFFLVGSSSTHIYLWEFGKDKATETYGILPVTNAPSAYALASVSALQFDHCGHRFASAALDGTVCTWQLEVGGRSNVYPTESSFCFSNHASDVAYMGASGSIIAAAGSSANGVNVVVWDTLAPSTTSQASLVCHEGGARSISVFDNDVGSGSISPLIVTGGKSGDVGLHDFRFIATGKTKRNKSSSQQDLKSSGTHDSGMLWYIPRAHLGSVTKVSIIPKTSLFLTGSKDGDVKLWDAKRSKLVFHWQKMHDRHTFLQPNSRGLGGVVRAAVTDIQVFSHGFLTCGGDGSVKVVQLN